MGIRNFEMFIHSVLFEIAPEELAKYKRDCRMWAAYAKKAKGFIRYLTVRRLGLLEAQPRPAGQRLGLLEAQPRPAGQRLGLLEAQPCLSGRQARPSGQRVDCKNQYASVYEWKAKNFHDGFMKKHHDWLVSKSQAKVKVLGYYNLKTAQDIQG